MTTTDPREWLIESGKIAREYRPTMHQDVVRAWAEDVSEMAPAMSAALLAVLKVCDQWDGRAKSSDDLASLTRDQDMALCLQEQAEDWRARARTVRDAITDRLKENDHE